MNSRAAIRLAAVVLAAAVALGPAACRKKKEKDSFDSVAKKSPKDAPANLGAGAAAQPKTWEEKYAAAQAAGEANETDRASALWEEIVREAETFGAADFRLPMALNDAAYFHYFKSGKINDAELHFRRLIEVRKEALGPDNIDVAVETLKLANLCGFSGRFDEADVFYKQALEILEKNKEHEKYNAYKKQILHDYSETVKKVESRKAEADDLAAQSAAIP